MPNYAEIVNIQYNIFLIIINMFYMEMQTTLYYYLVKLDFYQRGIRICYYDIKIIKNNTQII